MLLSVPSAEAERALSWTRATTPDVCRCFDACLPDTGRWPSMVLPVGSRPIELSHYPKARGARVARGLKRRSLENEQLDEPRCAVVRLHAPESSSLEVITSKSIG